MIPSRRTFLLLPSPRPRQPPARTGVGRPPAKPVIGAATAVPAKPQAAKLFTVSFKVRSSTTHKALTTGLMASTASAGG